MLLLLVVKVTFVSSHASDGVSLMGIKVSSLSPAAVYLNKPTAFLPFWLINILPWESYTALGVAPKPWSPIHVCILAELSTKNKILAATSPSPAPGGTGFEYELLFKNINIKRIDIIFKYFISALQTLLNFHQT